MDDSLSRKHVLQRSQSARHSKPSSDFISNTKASIADINGIDEAALDVSKCPRTRQYNAARKYSDGNETERSDFENNKPDNNETEGNVSIQEDLNGTKLAEGNHSVSNTKRAENPELTLGMSSFSENDRHAFGRSLRLSMALIQGKVKATPPPAKALPDDTQAIEQRLKSLNSDITCAQADLLELLVRFDERQGWKPSGAKHCAAWMNVQLGISLQLGWEYLRVGRQLRELPVITALFRAGQLTWSKVRLLSRVADSENESLLCHAALDASVSQVERLCHAYRWAEHDEDGEEGRKSENAQALRQWDTRALRWDHDSTGNVRISLSLPPDTAQAFLNSVEYTLGQLAPSDAGMAQRRADAAVLMAENNLQSAGREIATADRYQVIVSVDAAELSSNGSTNTQSTDALTTHTKCASKSTESDCCSTDKRIPPKRAILLGASSGTSTLAKDTARRIACDCSVSTIINRKGEPVDVGQKTRIWPAAMARAVKARDQQCVYPGCTQSQHLQIHHIVHWADGGATAIDNAASLCSFHHTRVHEGGYRIERVENHQQRRDEQFRQQTIRPDEPATDVERRLRNSPKSFDVVRQLSPERFRFRVIDSEGRDVASRNHSTRGEHPESLHETDFTRIQSPESQRKSDSTRTQHPESQREIDSTRVEQPKLQYDLDSTHTEHSELHHDLGSVHSEQQKLLHALESIPLDLQDRHREINSVSL